MFGLALVDLPLYFETRSAKGQGRSPGKHYDTVDVPALCRMRPMIDRIMAEDSVAAFWVYGPRLPDTYTVLTAWGFTYKSELFVWTKVTKAGLPRMGTGL